jgi:hypothetical protein
MKSTILSSLATRERERAVFGQHAMGCREGGQMKRADGTECDGMQGGRADEEGR